MRCEKTAEFDDVQCEREAEVRADCTPADDNEVGHPATSFWCRGCADHCSQNRSWVYAFTDMETGDEWTPPPVTYLDVPVVAADASKSALMLYVQTPEFRKAADQAMRHVADWGVATMKLTVSPEGVVAHTRAGERVLVRFE